MVHSTIVILLGLAASTVTAIPLNKRIAQTISSSTAKWEAACIAAGGGQECNPLSVTAFSTLLAAAGPCAQQNAADKMVDLAKKLNNDAEMIRLAKIFVQQPRNTPSSESVPYCQQASSNEELNGLFQCQFQGAKPNTFVGGVSLGSPGTIPFGLSGALNPLGSCSAHPSGPIADGTQLADLVQDPGSGIVGSGSNATPSSTAATPAASSDAGDDEDCDDEGEDDDNTASTPSSAASAAPAAATTAATTAASSGGFKLQNGKDAQALNAKFATLTADSSCTEGESACVGTGFAQCVGGKFVVQSCGASLTCAALPLVNKAGTSITCTTEADAAARIAATGATGGVTSSDGAAVAAPASNNAATTTPAASTNSGGFKTQNGKDAQQLNAKFATLTADSSCTDGENACVGTGFAQCVGGKFVVQSCGASLMCAALPLVNKAGTSITCTTQADAAARITASGATGGITGA